MLRFLLLWLLASPVLTDEQIWLTASVQAPLGSKFFGQFELQPRLSSGASRFGQVITGPALGVHIAPATSLTLGYNYVILDPELAPTIREHRL